MKSKGLICLALILGGGWFGPWSSLAGQTNSNPQLWGADLKTIRLEAEVGNAQAQTRLAGAYLGGNGVPKDLAQAFYWFKKAAEQGDPLAEGGLGTAYINGEGVAKDEKEGFKWFKKAADQGFFYAQDQVGVLYQDGTGIDKDLAEAFKWYSLAAQQGFQPAVEHKSALAPFLTPEQIYQGHKWARDFVPVSETQSNRPTGTAPDSNAAPTVAVAWTKEEAAAKVQATYTNFISMVTNRTGPKFGPVAAQALAIAETNFLTAITNSAMQEVGAAGEFLTELKLGGRLPGVSKDSHGAVTTETMPLSADKEAKYPFAVTINVLLVGDSLTNHYTATRPSPHAAWQLDKAWRTDAEGHTLVEWPVR